MTDAPVIDCGSVTDTFATEIVLVERVAPGMCVVTFASRYSSMAGGKAWVQRNVVLRLALPEASLPLIARTLLSEPKTPPADPMQVDDDAPRLNS